MIVLYIFLGILLFLFLLTLIPVRAHLSFKKDFDVKLKYLFLTFDLLKEEEKEPEKAKKTEPEKEDKKEKSSSGMGDKLKNFFKRKGVKGFMDFVGDVVKLLGGTLKNVFKHLMVSKFDLYLCVGGDDASEIALQYGQMSAVIYPAFSAFFQLVKPCRNKAVTVDADFESKEAVIDFEARMRILPIFVIVIGLSALLKALSLLRRFEMGSAPIKTKQAPADKEPATASDKEADETAPSQTADNAKKTKN